MIIYIVMKSLRKLLCCCLLCFLFFGVLPGSALAVEYPLYINSFTVNPQSGGSSFSPVRNYSSGVISALISSYDFTQFWYSSRYDFSSPFTVSGNLVAERFSFPAGFNSDEFTVYFDALCYLSPVNFITTSLYYTDFCYFTLTPDKIFLTVFFSDGTSQVLSFVSLNSSFQLNTPFSFTFRRNASSNQYVMTSDDFYLASDDVTASVDFSFASFTADMSATGAQIFSSGYSTSIRTSNLPTNQQGPYDVDNRISISNTVTSGGQSFSLYALRLALQCLSATLSAESVKFDNVIVDPQVDFNSIDIDHGVVDQSLVTLVPVPEDVYIKSFDFSVEFSSFPQYVDFDLSKPLPYHVGAARSDSVYYAEYYWFFKANYYIDTSAGDGSAGYLASILSFLRYDLPQQLKHLIIPTTEEVTDVISDAADNIKQNAGGLGQALQLADDEVKELQQAITSSEATPFILPALEFDCFGNHVKLWEDTDFTEFLQNDAVRLIMTPAELMMIYIFAKLLLRQFYLMFVCLSSGMSYSGFLRYLTSSVD